MAVTVAQAPQSKSAPPQEKAGRSAERPPVTAFNPVWSRLAWGIQPKLAVTAPDDPSEREADRVADTVMRMPAPQVQRSCAACSSGDGFTSNWGSGNPLDAGARAFFEPRFGADLSGVRVHADAQADRSARGIDALAFTYGRDVVFRSGHYAPHSETGRRLLAHELTHVVQQNGTGRQIQRKPDDDFRVTQVQPKPEERTTGLADRFFFEFDRADFRSDVPAEAAEQSRLESWGTAHTGKHVRLVGRASQEGDFNYNRGLAQRRAETVRQVLTKGGVTVDGTQVDMSFSQRPVDYRFYRSVEVITAGSAGVSCSSFTPAQQASDVKDCEKAFTAAQSRAVTIAKAGMDRLRPAADPAATPAPDRDAVLSSRFPGISRTTLLPRFESVTTRLGEISAAAGHECNHRCAAGCERPAASGVGSPLKLCGAFYVPGFQGNTLSVDERVFLILHETTHSAVVPGSVPAESVGVDVAYANTRLFGALTGSEALRNADSYVVTLLTLARDSGGAPAVLAARGTAPADTLRLTTPPGEKGDRNRTAVRAIGFAGSWLNYASFWTSGLYDFIAASLTVWNPDRLGRISHTTLELYAPLFKLQHPGTEGLSTGDRPVVEAFQREVAGRNFPTPPTARHAEVQDRTRTAGVYDRLSRMLEITDSPLVVDRAASGDGSWDTAPGLPGLGTGVHLADSFFSLAATEQTRHVIRLMGRAMADVGTAWVESYVEAADGVHRVKRLGP